VRRTFRPRDDPRRRRRRIRAPTERVNIVPCRGRRKRWKRPHGCGILAVASGVAVAGARSRVRCRAVWAEGACGRSAGGGDERSFRLCDRCFGSILAGRDGDCCCIAQRNGLRWAQPVGPALPRRQRLRPGHPDGPLVFCRWFWRRWGAWPACWRRWRQARTAAGPRRCSIGARSCKSGWPRPLNWPSGVPKMPLRGTCMRKPSPRPNARAQEGSVCGVGHGGPRLQWGFRYYSV